MTTARLIVHGGVDTEPTADVRAALDSASDTGYRELAATGDPVAAVVAAITVLEDSPLLNAGRGAVLDEEGRVRLDVGLVDGASQRFAGLTGLEGVANAVAVAARLLQRSNGPVLLAGEGATRFALVEGHTPADLRTPEQIEIWETARADGGRHARSPFTGRRVSLSETVGCIAVAPDGRIAAGSSTGGVLLKSPGRVGDAAVLGAGVYADDQIAALCSGEGEVTIELSLALRAALRCRDLSDAAAAAEWAVRYGVDHRGMAGGIAVYDARSDAIGVASSLPEFAVLTHDAGGSRFIDVDYIRGADR